MSAQKARGADFESGNIFQRAKALIPILVPLFISAFRRADEAMYHAKNACKEAHMKETDAASQI